MTKPGKEARQEYLNKRRINMSKTLTIEAPGGYEFTGEIRPPKYSERYYHVGEGEVRTATIDFSELKYPILCRVKQRVLVLPLTPELEVHVTSGRGRVYSPGCNLVAQDIGSDYAIEERD